LYKNNFTIGALPIITKLLQRRRATKNLATLAAPPGQRLTVRNGCTVSIGPKVCCYVLTADEQINTCMLYPCARVHGLGP
jgi:hypothetical protein